MESEGERVSQSLRAIIVFKRHYEIALANEMHGYARTYAQIEIYWKIENTFSCPSRLVTGPSDVPVHRGGCIAHAVHRLARETAACMQLRAGRFEADSGNRFAEGQNRFVFRPRLLSFIMFRKKEHREHEMGDKWKRSTEITNVSH